MNTFIITGDVMKYLVKQFFEAESSTYTYFIIDKKTNEAVVIDPVIETLSRDLEIINELKLKVKYILDTHVHADHITAAGKIRDLTGAKTVIGAGAKVDCADILIKDQESLYLGSLEIKAIATPGHTDSCTSYYVPELSQVFTGDALLIRSNGRTDFQQGSPEVLYESIQKLFQLPDETVLYPAHDYKGRTSSTIEEEKKFNPRIGGKTKKEFIEIMNNLKLPNPKKIELALPANFNCGK
jgi:sulfur dioxygenase